jgi:hypothetical protein
MAMAEETALDVVVEYLSMKPAQCVRLCLGQITVWEYLDAAFAKYHRAREAFTRANPGHPWARAEQCTAGNANGQRCRLAKHPEGTQHR